MQSANVLGYTTTAGSAGGIQQEGPGRAPNAGEINVPAPRSFVQPLIVDETKQYMEGLVPDDDDDGQDDDGCDKKGSKKTRGRVKIKMEFIQNKLRRYTTFSKRKTGIMKKAYELSTLTGTQVMLLVASETGHVYTFATRKLQPMITSESGKALIQTCLNSPDPSPAQQLTHSDNGILPDSAAVTVLGSSRTVVGNEDPEIAYTTRDEDMKASQASSPPIGTINYVNQSGQSYPMTAYIAPTVSNQTTILAPSVNNNQSGTTVQLQAPTVAAATQNNQPQIISGQLQLHRIHPQNILLTGSSPVLQSNHVILNNSSTTQPVVLDASQNASATRHTTSNQDVIALVNPDASSRLQMVYSPSGSAVIYTPQGTNLKRANTTNISNADVVALQHTPVIQTSAMNQDGGNG
ncbi:serum response factor-like [Clytia hemisphaerica]|uniref:MADS-box domain-containing protein n=1 Tax=Clytia hemisphaerica TaxID=252671 RepID=A0A7M5WU02_9CNID